MFKHILIATDGSPLALKAAKAGVRLAARLGARVTAYHAVEEWRPPLYSEGHGLDVDTFQALDLAARQEAERQVAAVAALAKAARVPFTTLVTNAATPYEGIIDAARKRKCDLIFMASHGRRGFSRVMMGSVSHKVLALATLPVVVYR